MNKSAAEILRGCREHHSWVEDRERHTFYIHYTDSLVDILDIQPRESDEIMLCAGDEMRTEISRRRRARTKRIDAIREATQ